MTDRASGFFVTLDDDYRIGDEVTGADRIRDAIAMIKGVASVDPAVSDWALHVAQERAEQNIRERLWTALRSEKT